MSKIRKKDPCPCGSGKRYKDCCFKAKKYSNVVIYSKNEIFTRGIPPGEKPPISLLEIDRFKQWLLENTDVLEEIREELKEVDPENSIEEFIFKTWTRKRVKEMSTQEIIDKLQSMHVHFDAEEFKTQVDQYMSAIQLAEDFYYTQDWQGEDDDDFIWLAITELWSRLKPEQVNIEMLDCALQRGYDHIQQGNYTDGLKEWETAWNMVKALITPEITSIGEADQFIPEPLTQCLFNWCQDFEMELQNGEIEDRSWIERTIAYTREFCERFPDTEDLILLNMLRAEAASYALRGDIKKAETLFEALTQRFPHNVWVYIGWGDIYLDIVPDYDKAEKTYRLGLEHCTAERNEIYERLNYLKEEYSHLKQDSKGVSKIW